MRLDLGDFGRRKQVIVTLNIPNVKFAVVRQEPRFVEALNAWSVGQAWTAASV
jgi:hypothetical protein